MDNTEELQYYKEKYQKYFNISNPLYNNDYSDIYIKKSEIHGLGVFANKDFNKGEAITRYPAHYIYKLNQYPIFNINLKPNDNFKDYRYDLDDNIVINGHPKFINNMSLVGHICNDGYKHNFETNNKKNRNKYNNSTFLPCDDRIINIVSFKNIKKDEEILVPYGFNYWLNRE
jgi:SET domain-containing protein